MKPFYFFLLSNLFMTQNTAWACTFFHHPLLSLTHSLTLFDEFNYSCFHATMRIHHHHPSLSFHFSTRAGTEKKKVVRKTQEKINVEHIKYGSCIDNAFNRRKRGKTSPYALFNVKIWISYEEVIWGWFEKQKKQTN